MPRRRAKGWRGAKGGEGRCEKSSAAYVGFLARLAATVAATATTATAAAAALIRVRRYEIIKLGLNSGEGDGMTRGSIPAEKGEKAMVLGALDVGDDGTLLDDAETRGQGVEEIRGITVFRIPVYERQPRRPRYET